MSNAATPTFARLSEPDYLARLVERAAQRAPVLERRRASLYEQQMAAEPVEELVQMAPARVPPARPDFARAETQHATPPEASVVQAAPRVVTRSVEVSVASSPVTEVAPQSSAQPISEVQSLVVTERGNHGERPEPERSSSVPQLSERVQSTAMDEISITHLHHHTQQRIEVRQALLQRLTLSDETRAPTELQVAAPSVDENSVAEPTQRAAPQPPDNWGRLVRHEAIAQPVRVASVRAAAAVAPPEAAAPVHISIGRVEVRASSAPATTKTRSAPRGPELSLEEYLRQRGGGSR